MDINKDYIEDLLNLIPDSTADKWMVDSVARKMEAKLKIKRDQGMGGWLTTGCSNEHLKKEMVAHIEKGDMVDVLNFAGMILMRQEIYGDDA